MTVSVEKARCPQCGNTETFAIYIRNADKTELVCRNDSRREGSPHAASPSHAPLSRRAGRRR